MVADSVAAALTGVFQRLEASSQVNVLLVAGVQPVNCSGDGQLDLVMTLLCSLTSFDQNLISNRLEVDCLNPKQLDSAWQ